MMRARWWLVQCLSVLATVYSAATAANPLAELQASGHLRIDSALTPSEGIVPGQRVQLTIKIATDTWFTGGTRIGIPEVPGLVILQTEQFASNASETLNGQSWVVQNWTLDVFPQRAGNFTIGPVPLQIQVNAGEGDSVSGEVSSPPLQFTVAIPPALAEATDWVAAPEFRISQRFDRALENLAAGDAFTQEVVFEASDVLAMMLPRYAIEKQAGLAAYPSPPALDNSTNRGQHLARRSVEISYVVEQPGHYVLPAREYYWWNTQRNELTLVSVPATHIDVSGAAVAQRTPTLAVSLSPRQWLLIAGGVALAIAVALLARRLLVRLPLARWQAQGSLYLQRLRGLFRPALATRLNPGSSAEE